MTFLFTLPWLLLNQSGCTNESSIAPFEEENNIDSTEEKEITLNTPCNEIRLPVSTSSYLIVDDNSWYGHYHTIQEAIDEAEPHTNIFVCPGLYEEQITIDKDIKLISIAGAKLTTIDGSLEGKNNTVLITASGLLKGFTITGATHEYAQVFGAGIYVHATPEQTHNTVVIQNNIITNNSGSYGGGIFLEGFRSSRGEFATTSTTLTNNIIVSNTSTIGYSAGIVMMCDTTYDNIVENNLIGFNDAQGIWGAGALQLLGEGENSECVSSFSNNIVIGNQSAGTSGLIESDHRDPFNVSFNDFYFNTDQNGFSTDEDLEFNAEGNINTDPLFASGIDFTLSSESPCIDAGNPNPYYNDLDGSRNDMGVFGGVKGSW